MKILRRKARIVKVGNVRIGGNNPVAIQSMAKVSTADAAKVVSQIKRLQDAGCEIVRVAVKDTKDAKAIKAIKKAISIPLVADIHFDWRLAIEAIDSGVDKIRLNPGNIYKKEQVREVVKAAKLAGIPIRVGLNSGSLPKENRSGPGSVADIMVKSALSYVRTIEKYGFSDLVISLKASEMLDTIEAYRKIASLCDYPLHLGLTATGLPRQGLIKSSIAIGALLLDGIGDTIRISLTDSPEEEVKAAKCILESMGLRRFGPQIVSCPTCGRCEVNLIKIVNALEQKLQAAGMGPQDKPFKVAVMGCVVNGPGEAKEADLGVAFGKKEWLLFKNGKSVRKISFSDCADVLLREMGKKDD
ncbi:MAG: flavodoxin-dependent (E)-4-hydroxy-3-methylbut-2-enyl-diphosphate synthase [Candidatus Omnitrophica bacterium]|nr:flavodoxin-dependent (E)-4-hydroxy-3-methylbut-2-enyl-diphosphate synthase [Candidatus Omnitrophota bacterium]